ncbi:NADP(H)-dependent aldo-keto reductase [Neptunomonas sp. XY-337]|uniref:NADP(H)-dependent aldo-keto reductase n=1 Tax=Neptunomonas sp. XY-337 TaxID=2561897 RepID=UPI0010AA38A7|nr:NADP(H)-dependent aldo-keto reductase [Neptunomonas sp. XY-337]
MHYQTLGHSDLRVSRTCLGTMTFGSQNTEQEACEQLDYAAAHGVNFLDAAEMYPVPTDEKWQGLTETYIGNWMKARGNRSDMVVATKASGPADMVKYLRPNICFDRANLRAAVEGSLQRLQTDYIDLYQLHWPDRSSNFFGQLGYQHNPDQPGTPILETLTALKELVDEGKIRYIGLSNETPWGVMKFLQLAEAHGLPRVVSVQNPYNLLNRKDEVGLAEVLHRENVGLLAYSPLGFGVLSGKYLNGQRPEGSRLALYPQYERYVKPRGVTATEAYVALAREHGLSPAQMALAFVNSQPFLGANIIGATTLAQLEENIAADALELTPELMSAIEAIHEQQPNPAP